jgi:hypothetical protein
MNAPVPRPGNHADVDVDGEGDDGRVDGEGDDGLVGGEGDDECVDGEGAAGCGAVRTGVTAGVGPVAAVRVPTASEGSL